MPIPKAAVPDPEEDAHFAVVDWGRMQAWDMWGYEVGNFPAGWGEWNGRYRDAIRRFMKGDGNTHASWRR